MGKIDEMLKAAAEFQTAAEFQRTKPLRTNATELFMRGHITADECESVAKGEDYINQSPHIRYGKNLEKAMSSPLFQPTNDLPIGYYTTCTKRFVSCLQHALEIWIPNQIDHVVIRVAIDKDPELSPTASTYTIRFKLIDVRKETAQQMATRVPLDWSYFGGNEDKDEQYWKYIEEGLEHQLQMIVIQLIRAIRTGAEIA